MAIVNANNGYALNMLNLNLSNETTYGSSHQILSNITDVYGTTYPTVYQSDMEINGTHYRDFYAGNFSTNAAGAVTGGTVNGYYEYAWNGNAWDLTGSLRNFSYSAVDFYNAAISGSQTPTFQIEAGLMSGNGDRFNR